MKASCAVFSALSIGLASQIAPVAQTAPPKPVLELVAAAPAYSESFLRQTLGGESPQAASSVRGVAGFHFGHGKGEFQLNGIEVHLSGQSVPQDYCVKIASSDGRYSSLNPYHRTNDKGTLGRIETRSRIADELAETYTTEDMVIRALATRSCSEAATGALVPVVPPGANGADPLVVYINAPGTRAWVRLLDQHAHEVAVGTCKTDEGES